MIGSGRKGGKKLEEIRNHIQEELNRIGYETENMHVGVRKGVQVGFDSVRTEESRKEVSTGRAFTELPKRWSLQCAEK